METKKTTKAAEAAAKAEQAQLKQIKEKLAPKRKILINSAAKVKAAEAAATKAAKVKAAETKAAAAEAAKAAEIVAAEIAAKVEAAKAAEIAAAIEKVNSEAKSDKSPKKKIPELLLSKDVHEQVKGGLMMLSKIKKDVDSSEHKKEADIDKARKSVTNKLSIVHKNLDLKANSEMIDEAARIAGLAWSDLKHGFSGKKDGKEYKAKYSQKCKNFYEFMIKNYSMRESTSVVDNIENNPFG